MYRLPFGVALTRLILIAAAVVLVLGACASPAKRQTGVVLTGDHLKAAALPLSALGPDYADFALSDKSGPRTAEQLTAEALNPDDEAQDVARFGTQMGFQEVFVSERDLQDRSGVFYLANSLVLYASPKGAAGDLADMVGDQQRDFSGTTTAGTLQAFQRFSPKVGEKAYGAVIRLLAPGSDFGVKGVVNLTITSVAFRRDRVVGQVVLVRFDGADQQKEVAEMARKLDQRLQAVMRGESPDSPEAAVPSR